jgi:predicted ribosome quality control (RQC) complex YloA/Tae2 family protein
VGAQVQKVVQPEPSSVIIGMFGPGEGMLLLSCDPVFARAYFVTKRLRSPQPLPAFCSVLRTHLIDSRLSSVQQMGFDRVLKLTFEGAEGKRTLIAELMGKHSNLILVGDNGRILACAKTVGAHKSSRVVQTGHVYEPPPFPPRKPIYDAKEGDDLTQFDGASPFLISMVEAHFVSLEDIKNRVKAGRFEPVLIRGAGAYPLPLPDGLPKSSMSIALEQHYDEAVDEWKVNQLKQSLMGQLKRVLLARETALHDLHQAADTAKRAGKLQMMGELILTYGYSLEPKASQLDAVDYEGNPIQIPLNPELTFKENANKLFDKAKRAKHGASMVHEQIERLNLDRVAIQAALTDLERETELQAIESIRDEALKKRWLHQQNAATKTKEERPYEGNKIRELSAPGGWRVLYGENSSSNDYLTTRIAKPNDWWFHVRGGTSAHVLIPTANKPEKVSREALEFAAKIAVLNSTSKHSSYVPVDYTLKKYVRKPRGSAVGLAVYDHEKTIHIDCH